MGAGKYAASKKLTLTGGKPLSDEAAQSPCLGDWDGDGDHDMVLGFISGPYRMFLNNGDLTFTNAGTLTVDNVILEAHDGGPCMVDWDYDGNLDLLLGDGDGNIKFYKGQGGGSLKLVKDENHVIVAKAGDPWSPRKVDTKSSVGFSPATPGIRTKPFAADWNGDGKLDLLVGDYISIAKPHRTLTEAERKELAALQAKQEKLWQGMSSVYEGISKKAMAKAGITDFSGSTKEQQQKYQDAYMQMMQEDESFQKLQRESADLSRKINALSPEPEGTGLVWVYLRK